jgi:alanine racemase
MGHGDVVAWISREAIRHNLGVIRSCVGPETALCVAVKANAYGHGLEIVLPALADAAVEMAATATLDEAAEVRSLGWKGRILWFGSALACCEGAQRRDRIEAVLQNEVIASPTCAEDVQALGAAAAAAGRQACVHVNVETGMGRLGLNPDEAFALCELADRLDGIELEGVYTHLATADEADPSYAQEQLATFEAFRRRLTEAGIRPRYVHAANSAASLCLPASHYSLVRPGLAVYGYRPAEVLPEGVRLRPALRLTAPITLIKDLPAGAKIGYGSTFTAARVSRVAVVPVGYNDGYNRHLSNRAVMTVAGQQAPVVGRVSMDQTTIDVTDIPGARVGSEVIVIEDEADRPNSVEGLARLLGTIPYEITCMLGNRIERIAGGKG